MKWFKHDSMAAYDAKIKRLRLRHGLEGVGLYWTLVESVARSVEPHNLSFQLEEDSELIAIDFGISHERVELIMATLIELNLFQRDETGHVYCVKLRERSDEYTQKLLKKANQLPTSSRQGPEKVRSIRIEEKRTEEKKTSHSDIVRDYFDAWWSKYPKKVGKKDALALFRRLPASERAAMLADDVSRRYKNTEQRYIHNGDTYVRKQLWQDEISSSGKREILV